MQNLKKNNIMYQINELDIAKFREQDLDLLLNKYGSWANRRLKYMIKWTDKNALDMNLAPFKTRVGKNKVSQLIDFTRATTLNQKRSRVLAMYRLVHEYDESSFMRTIESRARKMNFLMHQELDTIVNPKAYQKAVDRINSLTTVNLSNIYRILNRLKQVIGTKYYDDSEHYIELVTSYYLSGGISKANYKFKDEKIDKIVVELMKEIEGNKNG